MTLIVLYVDVSEWDVVGPGIDVYFFPYAGKTGIYLNCALLLGIGVAAAAAT